MGRLTDYITDAVRRPREQLTRGQHNVRYAWELGVYCWRQLLRHRAEGMAAELTYRTIFSLIPVVVLGLVMFRVVGGLEDVQQKVENQLFTFFGVPEISGGYLEEDYETSQQPATEFVVHEETPAGAETVEPESNAELSPEEDSKTDGPSNEVAAEDNANKQPDSLIPATGLAEDQETEAATDTATGAEIDAVTLAETLADDAINLADAEAKEAAKQRADAQRETRASIRRTLHEATTKVASIDFASIGVFGLLLFVYAAVALADSTEYLFNRIYDAPKHRPIHIRLAIHWSIITLGSGLLAMSLYMSGQFVAWAGTVGVGSSIQLGLARVLSIVASWVLLFLLYALMPNTHVSTRAAAIGSLVGSLLWEGAKFGFQIYVSTAVPYSALYGSLGLIPLFLFWIYVTWLIVLFGLILTYTLQTIRGRRLRRVDQDESDLLKGDPDWMLPVMTEVALAFGRGKSIDHQEVADHLGLSGRIVHEMSHRLIDAGLLRRVSSGAGEEDALTLARPAEKIAIADILTLAHQARPTSSHPAWKKLANLKQAQRAAASDQTLAEIVV
jgi:membrane protein